MTTFTVHAPAGRDPLATAERLRFVRERPSLWAFLLPPVWLVGRGLWLALVLWCAAMAGLGWLATVLPPQLAGWLLILFSIWFAVSARDIERASLSIAGWTLLGTVEGRGEAEAEARWFARAARADDDADPEDDVPFGTPRPPVSRRPGDAVLGFEGFARDRR